MSTVEHPRPKGLLHNPAFSQVAVASGNAYDLHGGASGRTLRGTKPATFALIDDIG
jgi:hypothetical protein